MVSGPLHGIARYALELARRVPELEPGWQFVGLVAPEGLPDDLGDLRPRIPLSHAGTEFLSPWEQPSLLASLVRLRADLFHATSFSVPALWPGRLVATLHDANHVALPQGEQTLKAAYYRTVVAPRCRRARAIITVSQFSREELVSHLGLSPQSMAVIANGVDVHYRPQAPAAVRDFCTRRGLTQPYFAAVGSAKPFKNMALLREVAPRLPAPVAMLAGRGTKRLFALPDSVIELAPLPEEDMPLYYSGATALLFPSRYEGFGFPALEAMACGTPVVVSDSTALPELVGPAGLTAGPDDVGAWVAAGYRLFSDANLRSALSTKSQERARSYAWSECARHTVDIYRRALAT